MWARYDYGWLQVKSIDILFISWQIVHVVGGTWLWIRAEFGALGRVLMTTTNERLSEFGKFIEHSHQNTNNLLWVLIAMNGKRAKAEARVTTASEQMWEKFPFDKKSHFLLIYFPQSLLKWRQNGVLKGFGCDDLTITLTLIWNFPLKTNFSNISFLMLRGDSLFMNWKTRNGSNFPSQ